MRRALFCTCSYSLFPIHSALIFPCVSPGLGGPFPFVSRLLYIFMVVRQQHCIGVLGVGHTNRTESDGGSISFPLPVRIILRLYYLYSYHSVSSGSHGHTTVLKILAH